MKFSFEKIMKYIECLTIPIGTLALGLSLAGIDCVSLIALAGILCIVYILYAIYLWAFRPKFDWHLIHGHFLWKVIAFVLLVPSCITFGFLIYNSNSVIRGEIAYSPKNLVYDENLYTINDTIRLTKDRLRDTTYCRVYNLDKLSDSTAVHKSKIPDPGISTQTSPTIFWTVYYHFIDPGNQHMTTSQSGRGWSALIAILGVFLLNGLLVSSIIGWIDSRKEKWLKGEVRYKGFLKLKKHYVVIGGNDVAIGIVKQILDKIYSKKSLLKPYILIQTSRNVENFRRELFSTLNERQQQRIIINYGNRNSEEDLKDLCIGRAKEVYIIGEDIRTDDIESYHDTMNMNCLVLLRELYEQTPNGRKISAKIEQVNKYKNDLSQTKDEGVLRNNIKNKNLEEWWKRRPRLNCRVMFEYQTSFSVFQFFDIDESMDAYVKFTPFNYYELWAQNVFINKHINKQEIKNNFQDEKYLPLEGYEGIKVNDEKYVHLFIVGMSRMGIAMAIEAAHLCHYPNFEKKGIRTKITLIDKNAKEEKDFFIGRFKELFELSNWRYGEVSDANNCITWNKPHKPSNYKYLGGDFLDVEWEFINGGIELSAIQNYILMSANPMAKITIAICLPESNRSHAAALFLDKRIYKSNSVLQILSYNRYGDSIVKAISKGCSEYPFRGKLRGFGCAEQCMVIEHLILSEEIGEHIADAYAEGEARYAINSGRAYSGKSHTANNWSSIYNGNTLWTKLRCIDFDEKTCALSQEDIDVLANVEHNRWNVEELLMNFRFLEEDEQEMVLNGEKEKKNLKKEMAHLDICSNNRLQMIDRGIRKYDVLLTECLGDIYKNLKKKQ